MDFAGDLSTWQLRIAESPEGVARRMAAMEALAVAPGQALLDLGCGGGHLVRDLALAVGPTGRAVGLDVSADQLAAARSLCDGVPAVELFVGDATKLPFVDRSIDGLAAVQTLEYIPDVDAAIAEARRVLKRGAKAVFVSVLWDHWRYHGAEPALTNRMLDAWRTHCPHQMLPIELPGKLGSAGFGGVARRPIAFLNGALHANCYAFWAAKLVADYGIRCGIPEKEARRWLDQLEEADRTGRFGFVSVPVVTTATAL